jgi:hypothetical protein
MMRSPWQRKEVYLIETGNKKKRGRGQSLKISNKGVPPMI